MAGNIEDIRKRSKSLSAIAIGIILYVLAGGIFTDKGSFMLGVVKFEHPERLEYAIVVIFVYFLFRYYLSNRNNWPQIKKEILQNRLAGDSKFKRYADKRAQEYINSLIEQEIKIGGVKWHEESPNIYPNANFFNDHHTPIVIDKLQPKIQIRAKRNGGGKLEDFAINISRWIFLKHLLRKFKNFIRYNEDFWDKVFPYLLSYGAIIAILYEIVNRLL